jgi:hypothetical protein
MSAEFRFDAFSSARAQHECETDYDARCSPDSRHRGAVRSKCERDQACSERRLKSDLHCPFAAHSRASECSAETLAQLQGSFAAQADGLAA